jgi:4-amino-4-deoxy-L-arabinose transferase-like glycosyltransferase
MSPIACSQADAQAIPSNCATSRWALTLFLISVFILFYHLGAPALFEPDEGRNAEKAREILLTQDWVTPHEDFMAVLDKPIFFYWLIAFSYRLFGISEWTARLPSALAALGTILLIYLWVRNTFGVWEALWSGLILAMSTEFFFLARTVIFDMSLTFFITLGLCCFSWGLQAEDKTLRRLFFLTMYAALGAATLVKGLVGFVLPAMIIGTFLLFIRNGSVFKKMDLLLGSILFLLIVLPWYVWVEIRNPGYLRYFFWEEHFARFLTPHFQRSGPWYYFLVVLAVGWFPWTFLLPQIVVSQWKRRRDERSLFLVLWTLLLLVFFSFSHSKLPHYILPLYPPLAVLTGVTFVKVLSDDSSKPVWTIFLPFYAQALLVLCFVVGAVQPSLLPREIGKHLAGVAPLLYTVGAVILVALSVLVVGQRAGYLRRPGYLYIFYCIGLVPLFVLLVNVMTAVSVTRSAKALAERSSDWIRPGDQLVLYDNSLEGLAFYLGVKQPIWIVWSGRKSEVIGSFYVAEHPPAPMERFGKVLFTFDEFAKEREKSNHPLFVFIKEQKLPSLTKRYGTLPNTLLKVDDFVLAKIGDV